MADLTHYLADEALNKVHTTCAATRIVTPHGIAPWLDVRRMTAANAENGVIQARRCCRRVAGQA